MLTNNEKEILRTIIKDCKKANIPRSTVFEFLKWYLFVDYTCNNIDSYIMRFHKLSSIDFGVFNNDLLRTIAVHVSQFFINSYIIANAMESIFFSIIYYIGVITIINLHLFLKGG